MIERPTKTKSEYPISLDEAKRHLRIDDSWTKDNDYIRNCIWAATQKCEEYIGKDIALTANAWKIRDFVGDAFWIQEGNWLSLTNVKQSDDATELAVDHTEVLYNRVYVELSASTDQDPLYVNYQTGYSAAAVPALIKQAVLVKVGDLYDVQRQSFSGYKENFAYERLLDSYKLVMY